ncbi:MAG TPA: phosphotransferase [Ktedonobacterales bacterium]
MTITDHQAIERGSALLSCPRCGDLLASVAVNPSGEMIGCEACAISLGLAAEIMSLREWESTDLALGALREFGLTDASVTRPAPDTTPRLHYWLASSGGHHYYLRRFHDWFPDTAVVWMHSVMGHLADRGLPVPHCAPSVSGQSFARHAGAAWALYRAVEGHTANEREWMWGRPRAAETLAQLHTALEGFTPQGEPFDLWGAWTLDTVDRVLASWEPMPELPDDLLAYVRHRLATHFFAGPGAELPHGIVHGDLTPGNLLWRGEANGLSIAGILDFERAHHDTALMDFAWGLGDRRPPLLRATVAAYARHRPLSAPEREAMPEAMLLGTLMALDMQLSYYHDLREATRLARELAFTARDLEGLRRAVSLRG